MYKKVYIYIYIDGRVVEKLNIKHIYICNNREIN